MTKYDQLLQKYTYFVKNIAEYYNRVRKGEVVPPIPSSFSPVAGRVTWSRLVISRISKMFLFFKRVYVAVSDDQREQW